MRPSGAGAMNAWTPLRLARRLSARCCGSSGSGARAGGRPAAAPGSPASPRSARGGQRGFGALGGSAATRRRSAVPRAATLAAEAPEPAPAPLYPHLLPVLDFVPTVSGAAVARALAAGLLAAAAALLLLSPRAAAAAGRAPPPAAAALAASAALGCALAAALLAAAREASAQAVLLSPAAAADADSRFGPAAGMQLHYKLRRPAGAAPCHVIVGCLHGLGANESSFTLRGAASGLARRCAAAVLAPDAPGFGLTPRPAAVADYGLARSAAAVNALLHDVAADVALVAPGARRVLLGHSLGGLLAVRAAWDAAARRTPYDALVLVAPAVIATRSAAKAAPAAQAALRDAARGPAPPMRRQKKPKALPFRVLGAVMSLLRRVIGAVISPPLLWLLRALVRSRGFWAAGLRGAYVRRSAVDAALVDAYRRPAAVAGWDAGMLRFLAARLLPDADADDDVAGDVPAFPPAAAALAALAAEGLPVLLLHGDGDALVPPANSVALAALAPSARHVTLRGVGHSPQEEAPEAFVDAVAAFLDDALKPATAGERPASDTGNPLNAPHDDV